MRTRASPKRDKNVCSIGGHLRSFLACLSLCFLSLVALYDYKSPGLCGTYGFEKPYFLTFCMFVGEALCLIMYYVKEWWAKDSTKIWCSRICWAKIYHFDHELAQRRREGLAHGITPYRNREEEEGEGEGEEDGLSELDEERSLIGSSQGVNPRSSHHQSHPPPHTPTPDHPNLNSRGPAAPATSSSSSSSSQVDQDLLDLHLSEEEARRRREANKPSKIIYLGLCLFDLSASAIGGIGLLYIDASANQMLRGSSVVFTAILSRFILRRYLNCKQWSGIFSVVIGLVLVGMSGLFRADALLASKIAGGAAYTPPASQVSPSSVLLGLLLILLGSLLNSIQNVFEEMLVKRIGGEAIEPLELVGWEGVWGMIITGGIVLPVVHMLHGGNCGRIENMVDTWHLMSRSLLILMLVLGYTVALALLNAFSVILSREVSATFRQLINALRVIFIWGISILLFYVWSHRTLGEGWDVYSYFQLGGFIMLIGGTIIYGTKEKTMEENPYAPTSSDDDDLHADGRHEPDGSSDDPDPAAKGKITLKKQRESSGGGLTTDDEAGVDLDDQEQAKPLTNYRSYLPIAIPDSPQTSSSSSSSALNPPPPMSSSAASAPIPAESTGAKSARGSKKKIAHSPGIEAMGMPDVNSGVGASASARRAAQAAAAKAEEL